MRSFPRIVVMLALAAALAGGGTVTAAYAHAGGDGRDRDCGYGAHAGTGRGHRLAATLGLSEDQKSRIRAIFEKHRPELLPLRKEIRAERRELRNLMLADRPDEGAIRAQARKVSATGVELAVARARMYREMRGVLIPEQVRKFRELRKTRGHGKSTAPESGNRTDPGSEPGVK